MFKDLAPSYFVGNLIEHLSAHGRRSIAGYAWFPIKSGKGPFQKWQITVDETEPVQVHAR